ncbi:hypothetical protein [Mycolicibacterium psychrotolerans]|uniref:Uncharacterized protein n=1 Tax=Mycolicibacterium psychrotolerans TaxID=216929 RepID=A0A7I7MD17_9MYCO|nr:hypothetical protein [Mycolicibacterium psychrotolerans]BBX69722.1 hypothetical protein MPSYJ_31830 [Mycolicibacterium psychrotolerans]
MTRRPSADQDVGQLYGWLVDREQRASWSPGHTLAWCPESASYTGTAERQAALEAGLPVDLPVSALPGWARVGEAPRWWRRATVYPDGTVTFRDDELAWIVENGCKPADVAQITPQRPHPPRRMSCDNAATRVLSLPSCGKCHEDDFQGSR